MSTELVSVLMVAVLFAATVIRSAFGFGEALVAVPLLALIVPVEVAAPVAVLVSITVAGVVLIQDWRHVHFLSAGKLIGATLVGIPLGLVLLTSFSGPIVKAILGVLRDYPDRAGETQVVEGREVGTALLYAAAIGHAGIMKYMMERGADADQVLEGPGLLPGMASMTTNIPEKLGVADALGIFAPDLASFYRNAGVLMVPDEQEISGVISRAQAGRSEWAHALDKQVQMRAVLMKTGAPINVSAGGRTGRRGPRL